MGGPRAEPRTDEKMVTKVKREDRKQLDCNQWLVNAQCSNEDSCSFKHELSRKHKKKAKDGKVDVSAKHRGLGNGKEMRTVLVGQAHSGAEIRDATTTSHGSR